MNIGINASKAAKKHKTGIDNTAYQIILNLGKIDKINHYYLYTNTPLSSELLDNPNFHQRLIPQKHLWHKFRLPLALYADKPDVFLELTSYIPTFAPKKSYVLIHDLAFKYFPNAYSKFELFEQESAIKKSLDRASKLIVTLEANKKDLIHFYNVDKTKIAVAPLAFDKETYFERERQDQNMEIDKPYFLFLGRLEARKNVKSIIEAFGLLKQKTGTKHKLVLSGFPGYGFEEIDQTIKQSRFNKDIVIPGYIPNDKLATILNNAEALVYPSLYEGFGLPILEAFACGTPVIISDIPTLKEVAAGAALITKTDPKSISEAMLQISDKKINKELSQKGKVRAAQFDWRKTAEEILKVIGH